MGDLCGAFRRVKRDIAQPAVGLPVKLPMVKLRTGRFADMTLGLRWLEQAAGNICGVTEAMLAHARAIVSVMSTSGCSGAGR